ncbi:hypothetical protein IE81DRAFT_321167 [Ceraceosorus guamensis]|uniref:UBC core domain-containing protein n=1 Tax=Ceraceosorus guamensis TaxID=1522189 RepID=A0A316W3S9_9BASI|nr:hypothetical protein IE81DRAFT_321167 [Ceraceosorus guamensis]PWN44546.1 hypothetical protein IE81DRAFT_321167 [Ceraceosorus guamensis]
MSFGFAASKDPSQRAPEAPPTSALLSHDAALQFAQLRQPANVPSGLYLSPTTNPTIYNGVLFVHKGYYAGAIFRFQIRYVSANRAPEVTIDESCAHPLVDPSTRRLLLASRFPSWRPRQDFLSHVLSFIKSIFKRKVLDNMTEGQVAHAELFRIYRAERSTFMKMASQSAASSQSSAKLYHASSQSTVLTSAGQDSHASSGGGGGGGGGGPSPAFLGPRFEKLKDEEYDALIKRILP